MNEELKLKKDWYTLVEVQRLHLIPFVKDFKTLRAYIERGYLKARILGTKRQRRYYLRKEWIIDFIVRTEDGTYKFDK